LGPAKVFGWKKGFTTHRTAATCSERGWGEIDSSRNTARGDGPKQGRTSQSAGEKIKETCRGRGALVPNIKTGGSGRNERSDRGGKKAARRRQQLLKSVRFREAGHRILS